MFQTERLERPLKGGNIWRKGGRQAFSWLVINVACRGNKELNSFNGGFVEGKLKFVNSAVVKCSLDVRYYFKIRNVDDSVDYLSVASLSSVLLPCYLDHIPSLKFCIIHPVPRCFSLPSFVILGELNPAGNTQMLLLLEVLFSWV